MLTILALPILGAGMKERPVWVVETPTQATCLALLAAAVAAPTRILRSTAITGGSRRVDDYPWMCDYDNPQHRRGDDPLAWKGRPRRGCRAARVTFRSSHHRPSRRTRRTCGTGAAADRRIALFGRRR